jgi:RNA polymerase sigma-70 factor (ECF subfamily)
VTAAQALAQVMTQDRGRLLAALVARIGDLGRAEEALQEAAASAHVHWGRMGVPASPVGWLLRVGLRKAIDGYRRDGALARHRAAVEGLAAAEAALPETEAIPDERLRLIFTCCHPALEPKTRVALTLRTLCGLTTAQVAAVYLDGEPTMGQRLSRARAKIAAAGIPFVVPGPEDWPGRLNSVLTVIYLVFTAGYTAGAAVGRDLCEEAVFLARMVNELAPGEAEAEGCLALLLLTHGRAAARVDATGCTVPPGRQDRALWDQGALAEGRALLDRAMARRTPGPFQIKAAIAACQARDEGPDWPQIAALYRGLMAWEPSAPVGLAGAVARMECGEVAGALTEMDRLEEELAAYQPLHAARAEALRRLGQWEAARLAYDRALALSTLPEDRAFLAQARAGLPEV